MFFTAHGLGGKCFLQKGTKRFNLITERYERHRLLALNGDMKPPRVRRAQEVTPGRPRFGPRPPLPPAAGPDHPLTSARTTPRQGSTPRELLSPTRGAPSSPIRAVRSEAGVGRGGGGRWATGLDPPSTHKVCGHTSGGPDPRTFRAHGRGTGTESRFSRLENRRSTFPISSAGHGIERTGPWMIIYQLTSAE